MRAEYPRTPIYHVSLLSYEIWSLDSKFRHLSSKPSRSLTTQLHILALIREGMILYNALDSVDTGHRSSWPLSDDFERRVVGEDGHPDLAPGHKMEQETNTYMDITRALLHNQRRALGIRLLDVMLSALSLVTNPFSYISENTGIQPTHWTDVIARLTEEICKDLPLALGEKDRRLQPFANQIPGKALRAYFSLLPLQVVLESTHVSPMKKQFVMEILKDVQRVAGFRLASSSIDLGC